MQSTEVRNLNMNEDLTVEEEYVTQHEPSPSLVLVPVGLRYASNRTLAEKRGQCVGHHNDTCSGYLGRGLRTHLHRISSSTGTWYSPRL